VNDESHPQQNHGFLTTHWSLVARAVDGDSPAAREAMEKLCRGYWFPIYAEVRRRGFSPHDAQDLTQEFFATLLRRGSFASARQEKGRFRSYLLGALKYFLADEHDRARAQRRGGDAEVLSFDALDEGERRLVDEPATDVTPEKIFDSRWAITLLDRALARLQSEYSNGGRTELFEILKVYLSADSSEAGYAEPAARLKMTTSAVAVAVHRMRQRLRECVRAEVAETVANPADVEDELRQLFGAL
jgi:DNA-directed RNA polymerase specialized sigma24 family protein